MEGRLVSLIYFYPKRMFSELHALRLSKKGKLSRSIISLNAAAVIMQLINAK